MKALRLTTQHNSLTTQNVRLQLDVEMAEIAQLAWISAEVGKAAGFP